MKYKWLLFDLDNTLLDFNQSEDYALSSVFRDLEIPYSEEIRSLYHQINSACWKAFEDGEMDKGELRSRRFELFLSEIGKDASAELIGARYLSYLSDTDFILPGALELLNTVRVDFHLAIITNGLKEVQRPRLRKAEVIDFFNTIVVSDEIGHSKPNPSFFDYTFEQMGHPPKEEALIIGDSLNSDIRGGNQFGVDTCWFNPGEKENDSENEPTYVISDLSEIKQIAGIH